jgi:hypothetical protein
VYLGLEVNAEETEYVFVSHYQTAGCSSAFKKFCINVAVFTELFRLLSLGNFDKVSLDISHCRGTILTIL